MILLAGASNGLLISLINAGAEMAANLKVEARIFFLYMLAFALYIITQRYALSESIVALEGAVRKVRLRIAGKIHRTELQFIEKAGQGEIYNKLTQDSNVVSQSIIFAIFSAQSSIVLLFTLFYIAWISFKIFLVCVATISTIILLRISINKKLTESIKKAFKKETQFFDVLNHLLRGFKEVKINRKKNEDLYKEIETISIETEELKIAAGIQSINLVMITRLGVYFLLPVIVFIMPLFYFVDQDSIYEITSATLFIIGPINVIMVAMPMLTRADVAIKSLYDLEHTLDKVISGHDDTEGEILALPEAFQKITLSDLSFHYTDKENNSLFSIGPVNLTINRGEILYIIGGNGSGKSTLLKLLTGLYYPDEGSISFDDRKIHKNNYQSYRELFSIIFTDFHLFDKLYGLRDIDPEQVDSLLRLMKLDEKTKYLEKRFTNMELSTGQKKRLAFISAMLENKPICIFDELAADQDPYFRKQFYEVILQDLKKQGKTIIAVTHDDHYFHTADRVLKVEYGQLSEYQS